VSDFHCFREVFELNIHKKSLKNQKSKKASKNNSSEGKRRTKMTEIQKSKNIFDTSKASVDSSNQNKIEDITSQATTLVYTMSGEAVQKPVFEKQTKVKIIDVKIMKTNNVGIDRQGKEFTGAYFQITTQIGDAQSIDNYSGIRFYAEGLWIGEKSAAGFLKTLTKSQNNLGEIVTGLKGKEVYIKTIEVQNPGNRQISKKNNIQDFA